MLKRNSFFFLSSSYYSSACSVLFRRSAASVTTTALALLPAATTHRRGFSITSFINEKLDPNAPSASSTTSSASSKKKQAAAVSSSSTSTTAATTPAPEPRVSKNGIFEWPGGKNFKRDPVTNSLRAAGAYVDDRVFYLPYSADELERRIPDDSIASNLLPLRMASLTCTERINKGTLLACIPFDFCASQGFAAQTPALHPLFEPLDPVYSATVGEATFQLSQEAICSLGLVTFAATTEGSPLFDLYRAIIEIENIPARWELMDPRTGSEQQQQQQQKEQNQDEEEKNKMDKNNSSNKVEKKKREEEEKAKCNHGEAQQKEGEGEGKKKQDDEGLLDENTFADASAAYFQQLRMTVPPDQWQFFLDLLAARSQVVYNLHKAMFGPGTKYEGACSLEDFQTCFAFFQSRSCPSLPRSIEETLMGTDCYIPFLDCADHKYQQQLVQSKSGDNASDQDDDGITLKVFRPTGEVTQGQQQKDGMFKIFSTEQCPDFLTPACQQTASIGIFTTRDIEPFEPITRKFDDEYRGQAHEGNIGWLLLHGTCPF